MNKRPEDMEDGQSGGKFGEGLLMPIFAVAAVFLFVILCFYAYSNVMKNKDNAQLVELNGDDSPFKVAPKDPGGMEVEHTDKAVFNTVTGEQENTAGEIKVRSEENPVSQEQLARNAEEVVSSIPVPDEGKTSTVTIRSIDSESAGAIETDGTGEEAAKIITIAADNAPTGPVDAAKTEEPVNMVEEVASAPTNTDKLEELKAQVAAVSDSASTVEAKKAEEPAKTEKAEPKEKPENVMKVEVKKETDKTTGESKTVVNFKQPPMSMNKAPSSVVAAPAGKGAFYVQVSSHTSREEAEKAWKDVYGKYSAEIGDNQKNISEADVKGKKYYRLSFGPFAERGLASTKCGILKAKGKDCIIQKY